MIASRISRHLTYANVVATLALVIALGAGSATAARMITGTDIRNSTLTGKDVKNRSLAAADIAPTARNAWTDTSPWETIPSGTTIRGSIGVRHVASANMRLQIHYLNLPAKPPVALTSSNVSFSADSASAAVNTDAACNGTASNPTAPAGKLCVYLLSINNVTAIDAGAWAETEPAALGAWYINWVDVAQGDDSEIRGTWAYTAP